jgi:hypothetical protein
MSRNFHFGSGLSQKITLRQLLLLRNSVLVSGAASEKQGTGKQGTDGTFSTALQNGLVHVRVLGLAPFPGRVPQASAEDDPPAEVIGDAGAPHVRARLRCRPEEPPCQRA